MVTLYPYLDFVAKTHALDAVAEPIKLKAFSSVGELTSTGSYALCAPCCSTERPLLLRSAGNDGRNYSFPTSLLNPMKSNARQFRRGFVSSYT